MVFRVRFTHDAQADLERQYDFLLEHADGNWAVADRALEAIGNAITVLEISPFSCRKASPGNAFLRELIIAFRATGYVALFEIDDDLTVTVLAVRHQREDDYH